MNKDVIVRGVRLLVAFFLSCILFLGPIAAMQKLVTGHSEQPVDPAGPPVVALHIASLRSMAALTAITRRDCLDLAPLQRPITLAVLEDQRLFYSLYAYCVYLLDECVDKCPNDTGLIPSACPDIIWEDMRRLPAQTTEPFCRSELFNLVVDSWATSIGSSQPRSPDVLKSLINHAQVPNNRVLAAAALLGFWPDEREDAEKVLVQHAYAGVTPEGINAAFVSAAAAGWHDAATFFLDRGAQLLWHNNKALLGAAYGGHVDMVQFLLDKHADIHAQHNGALEMALRHPGHEEVVKLLLERGILEVPEDMKMSLALAARGGYVEAMQALLNHGAPSQACLRLALDNALSHNQSVVAELLQRTLNERFPVP